MTEVETYGGAAFGDSNWYQIHATARAEDADTENTWALFDLAESHEFALFNVEHDMLRAHELYVQAGQLGHELAVAWLEDDCNEIYHHACIMLQDQELFSHNAARAVRWLQRSAEQNHQDATFRLGCCYSSGEGVLKNAEAAFKCYERAAQQGQTDSKFMLGSCYYEGNGCKQDKKLGLRWWHLAALDGDAAAQKCLGVAYMHGEGSAVDEKQGMEWFERSAHAGNIDAQVMLAECHLKGIGCKADISAAVFWYEKAAAMSHPTARFELAQLYSATAAHISSSSGSSAEDRAWMYARVSANPTRDLDAAVRHCTEAADAGHADAALFLQQQLDPLVRKAKAVNGGGNGGGSGRVSPKHARRLSASNLLMNLVGISAAPTSPIEAKPKSRRRNSLLGMVSLGGRKSPVAPVAGESASSARLASRHHIDMPPLRRRASME
mmetsp:Transcript_29834/g.69266  ORF Transcript_29834/g.69266 Transcript_29834/m.69266 type:complete len:438 (+) Transcript_29834:120-1433(+)|eukprot:CAMPEP_0182601282 /NCGR_PEP_ID=MMETSP1324-20130603/91407_1 /TAXON_ID=236786 /ORGANISM="Florenciella sp., Strain RCC1587" /LENGTH=437 /DNA_ID=CAMNT_0024819193 /DNA_START=120 /DNA_END=1433 /DNA_ORIENTATION=+